MNEQFEAIIAERDSMRQMLSQLRYKVEKIYELFGVPLEEDDRIINMVEYKRKLWASWQGWKEDEVIAGEILRRIAERQNGK